MLKVIGILCCMGFSSVLHAQTELAMTRQCSVIREILFQSTQQRFANIIDLRLHGSSGTGYRGTWTFSDEQFSTLLPWPFAAQTVIDHATDHRDSSFTESWQYIANFEVIEGADAATSFALKMVEQINGCKLPLSDSVEVELKPVPPEELPTTKPDNLVEAWLFELPAEGHPYTRTSIMAGLEKLRRGYRPVIIIEVLEKRKK